MPDDLVRAVSDYTGPAMFDRYIAAALEQRLRADLLDDSLAEPLAEPKAEFHPTPATSPR
jgi:hypothetical protein